MTTLMLDQNDIPSLTSFDGNIDADKLKPYIYLSQKNELKKALGTALYKKIYDEYVAKTLTGIYKIIYDEYVIDMLVFFSCSMYMSFSGVKISNKGNHKVSFSGGVVLSDKETTRQISKYNQLGRNAELNFIEYMNNAETPAVSEYKVDGNKSTVNNVVQWY
jgi:hypothetical protein